MNKETDSDYTPDEDEENSDEDYDDDDDDDDNLKQRSKSKQKNKQFLKSLPKFFVKDGDYNNLSIKKENSQDETGELDEDKDSKEFDYFIPQPTSITNFSKKMLLAKVPGNKKFPIIYQCSLCASQTKWRNRLKRHFTGCFQRFYKGRIRLGKCRITTNARFRCEYCFKTTKSMDVLVNHKKEKHAELIEIGLIECSHCNFTFWTFEELKHHMKEVFNQDKNVDSESVIPISELKTEEMDIHDQDGNQSDCDNLLIKISEKFACKSCIYETSNLNLLKIHEQIKHREKHSENLFRCPIEDCMFETLFERVFKKHLANKHNIKSNDISIGQIEPQRNFKDIEEEECSKIKKDIQRKLKHSNESTPKQENSTHSKETFACPELNCSYQTLDEIELFEHHMSRHSNYHLFRKRVFYCSINECDFRRNNSRLVQQHLIKHHNVKPHNVIDWSKIIGTVRILKCNKCRFEAMDRKIFKEHTRKNHWNPTVTTNVYNDSKPDGPLLFKCSECSFKTHVKRSAFHHGCRHFRKNNKSLIVFYQFVGDKPQGEVTFKYSDENLYRCYKCLFSGATSADLWDHEKRVHSKDPKILTKDARRTERRRKIRKEMLEASIKEAEASGDKIKLASLIRRSSSPSGKKKQPKSEFQADNLKQFQRQKEKLENSKKKRQINVDTIKVESKKQKDMEDNTIHKNPKELFSKEENTNYDDWIAALLEEDILMSKDKPENEIITIKLVEKKIKPKTKLIKKSPEVPTIENNIIFKCWMCSETLNRENLNSHTNLHGEELNKPYLKVRYTMLKEQTKIGNILIKNDPFAYYACTACDFKATEKVSLTKHEKLHWKTEKKDLDNTKQKCAVCLFQCYNDEEFRNHCQKHRARNVATIS